MVHCLELLCNFKTVKTMAQLMNFPSHIYFLILVQLLTTYWNIRKILLPPSQSEYTVNNTKECISQVIILHNLANWVTFIFSLEIEHSSLEIPLRSLSTVIKNRSLTIFKYENTNGWSIQVWWFFIKKP